MPTNPDNLKLRDEWILTAKAREQALAKRHLARHSDLLNKSKPLKPLDVHDVVQVQNQRGTRANKWDLSGTVVQILDYDAYLIKMDGSGRITKRNRQFLKPILPYTKVISTQPAQRNSSIGLGNKTNSQPNNHINSGPTAGSWEATSSVLVNQDKSGHSKDNMMTDTLPQSDPMSDADFNDGLIKSVQNVSTIPQKGGIRPEAQNNPSKRVRIATKRYISQY